MQIGKNYATELHIMGVTVVLANVCIPSQKTQQKRNKKRKSEHTKITFLN